MYDDVDRWVEISGVEVMHETDKALLCEIQGEEVWIPKSQLGDESEVKQGGDSGTLVVTRWLAEQKDSEQYED